ncbi:hypothetical protein D3C76_1422430 [compost metagenome]
MPGAGEVSQATLGLEGLAPDSRHAQQVVCFGEGGVLFFDQQPGDGGGVTQVDGQFQVRAAEECMLAGQATHQAGAFRIECQVMVPKCLVAGFGDSIQAVSTAVMQGGTKG